MRNSNSNNHRFQPLLLVVLMFPLLIQYSNLKAQTTLIDPAVSTSPNGSFENATSTAAANGWTTINDTKNKWYVGTTASCVGLKGAYISNTGSNNQYTLTSSQVSHLYKDVSFPAGLNCITLSFNYKGNGETNLDGLQVSIGSTAVLPVASADFPSTDPSAITLGALWYNMVGAACTNVTITIPAAYAGTSKRLVFSWKNNASGGTQNAAAIDNISLIAQAATLPGCATLNTPANNAVAVTKCNPVISWTAPVAAGCNAATQYAIYFGTSTNPPLLDITNGTSYQLGALSSSTKYYWRIIPANAAGSAVGCVTEFNFTTGASSCAVSPGGVGVANLTAWFKADGLSSGNLSTWTTSYPTGGSAISVNDPAAPYPQITNSSLSANSSFNYNQYISFSGNAPLLDRVLYNTSSSLALMTNFTNPSDASSFFGVYQPGTLQTDAVAYWNNGNNGMQFRGWGRIAIGSGGGNSAYASRDWTPATMQSIISYKGNRTTSNAMLAYKNSSAINLLLASESTGSSGISFGARMSTTLPSYTEYFDGNEAEHIFFNATLPNNLMNQVHSYLAIKYGTTLSTDYYSASGGNIYANNAPYNNNVIGIAREDNEGLLQKQSHNFDDTVRIYKGNLNATNAGNSASFLADGSYIVMGATNGKLSSTAASKASMPASCMLFSRLERVWKVTNTNFSESFNLDIKLSPGATPTAVNPSDLRLLVDDDGNFGNGGTSCYYTGDGTGIIISYANPVITVTGISNTHIGLNGTRYITIASSNLLTPLPAVITNFKGLCKPSAVQLSWQTASEFNNQYFEIERSKDGTYFSAIGRLEAKGNSASTQFYQFADLSVIDPVNYYRLKMVSTDNGIHYSEVITVNNTCNSQEHKNFIGFYPNPVSGNSVTLKYSVQNNESIAVKIIDVTGRILLQQSLLLQKGTMEQPVVLPNLLKGVYFIQFGSKQLDSTPQKFIKD